MASSGIVAWSETDASGWIHFTAPMTWAENAEHALCRNLDESVDVAAFPRKEVHATFRRPLRAGDAYVVELVPVRIGSTSVTFTWTVESGGEVCVEGGHTTVHVSRQGRPSPLPADLRARLEERAAERLPADRN